MKLVLIYLGVCLGVFLEGEMVMLSSVIAARQGYLQLWLVVPLGMLGTFISDCFYFFLGRKKGKKWIEKSPKLKKRAGYIHAKIERYPLLIFILYRFAYGLRTLAPIVIGTSETKASRFLLFSSGSILLWAVVYTTLGYAFGEIIKKYLNEIQHVEYYVIGGLIIVGLTIAANYYLKPKIRLRKSITS